MDDSRARAVAAAAAFGGAAGRTWLRCCAGRVRRPQERRENESRRAWPSVTGQLTVAVRPGPVVHDLHRWTAGAGRCRCAPWGRRGSGSGWGSLARTRPDLGADRRSSATVPRPVPGLRRSAPSSQRAGELDLSRDPAHHPLQELFQPHRASRQRPAPAAHRRASWPTEPDRRRPPPRAAQRIASYDGGLMTEATDGRRLAGRRAIVTGAARGIGAEIARTYVREGAASGCSTSLPT